MNSADIVSSIAAIFTTAAFIPQVIQVLKTRNTVSISFLMYSIFITGLLLWLIYGILIMQWPIIIANTITASLAFCIWWVKVMNMQKGERW